MTKLAKTLQSAYAAVAPHRLFQLIYFVTARCNARCKMCFYLDAIEQADQNLKNELTLDEIRQTASKLGHIPYMSLSGGEPFLRRDLLDVINALVVGSRPLLVSIPTNGAYAHRTEQILGQLSSHHPETQFDLQLSLDGLEDIHDNIRQVPGLFKRLCETHTRLRELQASKTNLSLKIVITYSAFNQDYVEKLLCYIETEMPVERVILAKAHGNTRDNAKDGLDMDRFRLLLDKVNDINRQNTAGRNRIGDFNLRIKRGKEKIRDKLNRDASLGNYCGAGRKIAVLSENGTVYPCEILDMPIGNVRDHDFNVHQILNTAMADSVQNDIIKNCHCDWGCAQNIAVISSPRFWPQLIMN